MTSSLSRELVFLILQFLDEEKFRETVHKYIFNQLMLPSVNSVLWSYHVAVLFS